MAEHPIDILLRARDQASAAIRKVNGELGLLGRTSRGVKNALHNLATIGAIGAGVLASQIALGARSLARIEKINAQTSAVIKSTGAAANVSSREVELLTQSIQRLTGIEAETVQEGANLLLTFTNIRNGLGESNDIFDQAVQAITDMSVALGQDSTQSAMQLGKALNNPIKGMTALQRVGVSFTKEQMKQVSAMMKVGDVAGAQKVILAELNKEFGGSAEAFGNTTEGKIAKLGNAWGDVQEALATGVMPAAQRLADFLTNKLADPRVQAFIDDLAVGIADAASAFVGWIETVDFAAIADGLALAKDAVIAIVNGFMSLPDWVKTAVVTGWGLNKLTGGALGDIVGELGRGLIKGVLGINAANVNINAANVNGGLPGVVGGGGKGALGKITGAATTATKIVLPLAVGVAIAEGIKGASGQSEQEWQANTESSYKRLGGQVEGTTKAVGTVERKQAETLGVTRDMGNRTQSGLANAARAAVVAGAVGASATGASASRIVSAIYQARPVINTYVTVHRDGSVSTRQGKGSGSAGGGNDDPVVGPR